MRNIGVRSAAVGVALALAACASPGALGPAPTLVPTPAPTASVATPPPSAAPSPTSQLPARPSAGCATDASSATPGSVTVNVGGRSRDALVHLPYGAGRGPLPLVLLFHSWAGNPEDVAADTAFSSLADRAGFVAVYPRAIGDPHTWDLAGTSDIAFVAALLTTLEAVVCIDLSRVFAAGFSMGGGMANVVGCRLADRIAAIASVSGLYGPRWGEPCQPSRPAL